MKRALGILLAVAVLLLSGLTPTMAEGPVYVDDDLTRRGHASRDCALAAKDQLEASFFGWDDSVYPCPACVPDERAYPGVEAWERGGTVIVRVPDAWMAEQLAEASEPAEAPEALLHGGGTQDEDLARLLHGRAYLEYLDGAKPGAVRSAAAFAPEYAGGDDMLLMSCRHLGGAWLMAVRPDKAGRKALAKSGELSLSLRLWRLALEIHSYPAGARFEQRGDTACLEATLALKPAKSDGQVVLRRNDASIDGFGLYVVRDGDVNTLVYRENIGEDPRLSREAVYCGQRFALNGYRDKDDAVFVCAVTDGEVHALEDGLALTLISPTTESEDDGEEASAEQRTEDYAPAPAVTLPAPEDLPGWKGPASAANAPAPTEDLSFLSGYADAVRVGDWILACAEPTKPEARFDSATRNTAASWVLLDGTGRVLAEDLRWWPENDDWPLHPRPFEGFEDGVNTAVIRVGQKYGLIDRAGRIVVEPVYDNIFGFTFGDASTPVEKDGRWGCIDEAGNAVVPLIYDSSFPRFENGCTVAERNGKQLLLGEDGTELLPPEFEEVILEADESYGMAHRGENCVLFDRGGNILFERALGRNSWIYTNDGADPPFPYWDGRLEKNGYINLDGTDALAPIYDEATPFSEGGTAMVQMNGKWGVIDRTGGFVIPSEYDGMIGFSEGLCPVEKDGLWGYLDEAGDVAVPFQFAWAGGFEGGYADASPRGTWAAGDGDSGDAPEIHGLIDRTGGWVIEPRECDQVAVGPDGVAAVCDGYRVATCFRLTPEGAERIEALGESDDFPQPHEDAPGLARLDEECALEWTSEAARLPHLDGAARLYPLFAAYVEAAYPMDVKWEAWDYGKNPVLTVSGEDNPWQRLTDGDADIIFAPAPDPEASIWATFAARGQEPEFIPLCRDAVVFPVHADNPVEDVGAGDLERVYAGEIDEWADLGGGWMGGIVAYQEGESGEAREAFGRVCGFARLADAPEGVAGYDSWGGQVCVGPVPYRNLPNAVGYALRAQCRALLDSGRVKLLSVNGVAPTDANIENGSYPYVETLCAVALKGNDNPNVRALLDWIQSDQGRELARRAGFAGTGEE